MVGVADLTTQHSRNTECVVYGSACPMKTVSITRKVSVELIDGSQSK